MVNRDHNFASSLSTLGGMWTVWTVKDTEFSTKRPGVKDQGPRESSVGGENKTKWLIMRPKMT